MEKKNAQPQKENPLKNKYAKEQSEKIKMSMSKQSPISHEEFLKRKP